MSKNNTRYHIAMLLPPDASRLIEDVQKKYQNTLWKIIMPPHVTLLRPGTALKNESEATEEFMSFDIAIAPPRIQANSINYFLNGPNANVIYLEVEPSPTLLELHQYVLARAGTFMEAHEDFGEYKPHITLANNIADENSVNVIAEQLLGQNLSVDYTATSLVLFKKADTDLKWTNIAEKSLV